MAKKKLEKEIKKELKATKSFDASTVELKGSNLIEASAGTGKTYSVAILVLRLIIEKNISIKEILMVTFTKAAVAELEERIRLFVRLANKSSLGIKINDKKIADLVSEGKKKFGDKEVVQRLKDAIIFLDETSVLTIHSFCQNTLTEFAFETNQLYGADALEDISELLALEVNDFWRTYITLFPKKLLQYLLEIGLKKSEISAVAKDVLGGKKYIFENDPAEDLVTNPLRQEELTDKIEKLIDEINKDLKEVYAWITDNKQKLIALTESNNHATKNFLHLIDSPPELLGAIKDKIEKQYVQKLYAQIIKMYEPISEKENDLYNLKTHILFTIYVKASEIIKAKVNYFKTKTNQMSFDDMIGNLHLAVTNSNNAALYSALQKKYRAVFLDEFQDTDKLQYEIFNTIFGTSSILFYIGDPKQSIYGWRKADIFTYFKAGDDVNYKHSMNVNYRSSDNYVAAMNEFFMPEKDFDTFHYGTETQRIDYILVEAPKQNSKGEFTDKKKPVIPISIIECANNEIIFNSVVKHVTDLLNNKNYVIGKDEKQRRIRPSDIGILVRTNYQGKEIKKHLSNRGIHAITVDDTKLFESEEAVCILFIIQAMTEISRSNIGKALLTKFTKYTLNDIKALDEEVQLARFREYKLSFENNGVYAVLNKFMADYGVKTHLMNHLDGGDRSLANLIQLTEVLHKTQNQKQFSPTELAHWLSKEIENNTNSRSEYTQRMESDDEAVKIVTIHKSKGLEYNIVLAPFLDMKSDNGFNTFSFRDKTTGHYLFGDRSQLSPQQQAVWLQQAEQENRRLLYVAITRAVYKCYIYRSLSPKNKNSCLAPFLIALKEGKTKLIRFEAPDAISESGSDTKPVWKPFVTKIATNFNLTTTNWRKLSYSFISTKQETSLKENGNKPITPYENFIFKILKKGNLVGNLLHSIFEYLDFTDTTCRESITENSIKRYVPKLKNEYKDGLLQLIEHTLNTSVTIGNETICLSSISNLHKLNELEFDFKVSQFKLNELEKISTPDIKIITKEGHELEGIMNGKMDLFFEYKNKYYILDWKSNFLGDTIDAYSYDKLKDAMNENNYHLQYLIYTLAAKKYLTTRLPKFNYESDFGGVIYLFLRGVRKDSKTGIFVTIPDLAMINRLDLILSQGH